MKKYSITVDGQTFAVEIENLDTRPIIVSVDGEKFEVYPEQHMTSAPVSTAPKPVIQPTPLKANGNGNGHSTNSVSAPIPGVIDSINVSAGDIIKTGQTLCVLEAMKMKNQIRANRDGRIATVNVSVGQQVNHGDLLVTYGD